jgi:hypothetical protein
MYRSVYKVFILSYIHLILHLPKIAGGRVIVDGHSSHANVEYMWLCTQHSRVADIDCSTDAQRRAYRPRCQRRLSARYVFSR